MVGNVKIINKDSVYFGQKETFIEERKSLGDDFYELLMKLRKRCGSANGCLVQLPDGEQFFFSPREVEFIN